MSEARTPDALDLLQSHKPQTEAGREHLTAIGGTLSRYMDGTEFWATMTWVLAGILAIEAEAAASGLDVEMVALVQQAMQIADSDPHLLRDDPAYRLCFLLFENLDEYARLAQEEGA